MYYVAHGHVAPKRRLLWPFLSFFLLGPPRPPPLCSWPPSRREDQAEQAVDKEQHDRTRRRRGSARGGLTSFANKLWSGRTNSLQQSKETTKSTLARKERTKRGTEGARASSPTLLKIANRSSSARISLVLFLWKKLGTRATAK